MRGALGKARADCSSGSEPCSQAVLPYPRDGKIRFRPHCTAVSTALLNTITADHDAAWRRQVRAARRLFASKPAAGRITVLVTHGSVVRDVTGLTLEEGETLVFRPLEGVRFRLLGRILPRVWAALRSG